MRWPRVGSVRRRLPGRRRRAGIRRPRSPSGDPEAAAETIFADNLLGGSCARVCPVEELCEGACVLVHEGRRPVEIARLQRYATDWALAAGVPLRRDERAERTGTGSP